VPGILFLLLAGSAAANLELASQLVGEADWQACRREAMRVLVEEPENETASLLAAVSGIHLRANEPEAVEVLVSLREEAASKETRAMAAYELGRYQWREGEPVAAFRNLAFAFATTSSHDLFLRSSCSLALLLNEYPDAGNDDAVTEVQVSAVSELWTPQVVRESMRSPRGGEGALSKPGKWIVAFYRNLIRPGIGARCSLEPSCSEYFFRASREHGLLGFPLIADRLIREPSVVAMHRHPTNINGAIRFADPVSAHDGWLKGGKK